MLLVLVFDFGIAGAAIAAVIAEATGLLLGVVIAQRLCRGQSAVSRATLFDRAKLMRMLAVNRDIMIRTAALITAFLFFTAQGARAGDVTLAANAVLNNFLLVSALLPRRPCQRRRTALRPRLWRARQERVLRRGAAGRAVGLCLCARGRRMFSRCSARR